MRGIDLSHWNGETGERILKDGSVELDFCICKHSEGMTMYDTMFSKYSYIAEKRKILHGGYHFYVGNQMTEDYKELIVAHFRDMYDNHGCSLSFIDWERELDENNALFIAEVIEAIRDKTGRNVGIYASYSVFNSKNTSPDTDLRLADYCMVKEIPIWCARYKYKNYRQPIGYGNNAVGRNILQENIGSASVTVNQVTDKCVYDNVSIDLDYDVAWNYGMG